jgi:hypothetical protein
VEIEAWKVNVIKATRLKFQTSVGFDYAMLLQKI